MNNDALIKGMCVSKSGFFRKPLPIMAYSLRLTLFGFGWFGFGVDLAAALTLGLVLNLTLNLILITYYALLIYKLCL